MVKSAKGAKYKSEAGFGVGELLVSTFMLTIVILGIASFTNLTFTNLGVESRASGSARELRNAISLLTSELRMGASVSPYLPGDNPNLINCLAQISATSNSIRFLVVHDDTAAGSGIQPYYVGYRYDPDSKRLLRGEIPGISVTSCSLPVGDPLSDEYARVIADRVFPYDSNRDGVVEPTFSYSNGTLTVALAVKAIGPNGAHREQGISTKIYTRNF